MTFDTPASIMKRKGKFSTFEHAPIKSKFESNGNVWIKVSTRTAKIYWPAGPEQSFYFGKKDKVYIEVNAQ